MRTHDWPAISRNARGNLTYVGRCAFRRLRTGCRGVCFFTLAVLLLVLMTVSSAVFAVLRRALWRLDANWLYQLERGTGMGPLELHPDDQIASGDLADRES